MADWKDNKGSGPWDFTRQPNKWGYLNNPRWSSQQDSVDFCRGLGLETGLSEEHAPCGHWHRGEVVPMVDNGKWVAAMQQPGTPYIYVYDIIAKAVIRINTLFNPLIVDGILRLNSAYALDYDMGQGNPGAQRGAYCMNKDATRIWYLFCDQGQYPILRGHPDAELVEVDITSYYMKVVKRTLFHNLLPAETFPDSNAGRVNDGCSDDTYTYWCTQLVTGRIIKIRNSDHVIVDDHYFNYPIEPCSGNSLDEAISTIEVDKSSGKLYWIYVRDHVFCAPPYNACRHLIRADVDLVADIDSVACVSGIFTPAWQNMVRIYSNYIFQHRAYHPSTAGYLMKRSLDWVPVGDQVIGTDGLIYSCILDHTSGAANKPITGGGWSTYWIQDGAFGGTWAAGEDYTSGHFLQEYLQNILGVKDNKLFTLMCVNSVDHPAFLYCLDFGNMDEVSKLDVSYYAGQAQIPTPWDWDWTSVSAMNQQTGTIAIFRYNNIEKRNYAGCFSADSDLGFLCDTRFDQIYDDPTLGPFGEPQIWVMPSDESPEPADPDVGGVISGPSGSTMCVGQTSKLSRSPISISTMEGTNPINYSVRITDNCNNSLPFQIEEVNNNNWVTWISSPVVGTSGNGALNISFNTTPLSAGNYIGSISISTSLGNLTLDINLVITSSPDYGEATGIVLTKGDQYRTFDFSVGKIELFKFIANSGPSSPTLIITTNQQRHGSLDFLVKYAGQNWEHGPPTESDYDDVVRAIEIDPYAYPPHTGVLNDIYYYRSLFHPMDAPNAYTKSTGWNCPYSGGHPMYCIVCREFTGCYEGEGLCNNWGQCAPGLICDEEVFICVKPVYTKQITINYPTQIINGCWYLWMKNYGIRGFINNRIYFDFS